MIDEKDKLEAMKTSLEIIKKYSTDPEEKDLLKELVETNQEEKVDDELMMKLTHSSYSNLAKAKESNDKY